MLRMKSVVIQKANLGIPKRDGRIKNEDKAVRRKRELFRIWKQSQKRKIGRNIARQKKTIREWYMYHAMMVVSCSE